MLKLRQAFEEKTIAPLQAKLSPAMRQAGWLALPRHATGLDSGHYMYVRLVHGESNNTTMSAASNADDDEAQLPFFTRARDAQQWWTDHQSMAHQQKGKKRRQRCGACAACLLPDCGTCASCVDKPAFGGRGLKKQACL